MSKLKKYTYSVKLFCPTCLKKGELREYFYPFFICNTCLGIFGVQECHKEDENIIENECREDKND